MTDGTDKINEQLEVLIITDTQDDLLAETGRVLEKLGYKVSYPEFLGVEDLLTVMPETLLAAVVDLDGDSFNGIGLIKDIQKSFDRAGIARAYRAPIIAISDNYHLEHQAKQGGAEHFVHTKMGPMTIAQVTAALNEDEDAPVLGTLLTVPEPDF